jgi:uncharacterized protein
MLISSHLNEMAPYPMQIQLEAHEIHTIQAYSETEIKINQIIYHTDLILSRDTLITPWAIQDAATLMLNLNPEVIILGTDTPDQLRHLNYFKQLEQSLVEQQIGMEYMTLDAACRTFNILLGEHRRVVAGFIFDSKRVSKLK